MKSHDIAESKSKISQISKNILDEKVDYVVGLREIYDLLHRAGFTYEDEDYRNVSAIVDETETVIKGDIRKNFANIYLEEQDKLEKDYFEDNKSIIHQTLKNFSNLPIIENHFTKKEDPYAWPFEEYK